MLVVTREEPHRLLGQLRRRDLLRLFIKSGNNDTQRKKEIVQQ